MRRNAWIAAIAAALVSTATLAQWGPGYGGGHGNGMGPGMGGGFGSGSCGLQGPAIDALGLNADQRARIAAILDESSARRLSLMEGMHELRSEAMRTGTWDYATMASMRERMFAESRDRQERIDAVLTPEQRQRWHGSPRGFGPGR